MIGAFINPRFWIPIISNGFIFLLIGLFNTSVSFAYIYVFIPGLFPLFLAFNRPDSTGLVGCTLTGFLFDSMTPVPMGLFATLFACLHAGALVFSKRVHRENPLQYVSVAFVMNTICWIAVTLFVADGLIFDLKFFGRFFLNFLLSQIVIIPIAWWYFDFQAALLRALFGIHIFDEDLA